MPENNQRLSDAMLEIMQVVWEMKPPITSADIHQRLKGENEWTLTSILAQISRLVENGFLSCEKSGRQNIYIAQLSEKEYLGGEGKALLGEMYGNSIRTFIEAMYEGHAIGEDDLIEVKQYIEKALKAAGRQTPSGQPD